MSVRVIVHWSIGLKFDELSVRSIFRGFEMHLPFSCSSISAGVQVAKFKKLSSTLAAFEILTRKLESYVSWIINIFR